MPMRKTAHAIADNHILVASILSSVVSRPVQVVLSYTIKYAK